MTKKRSKVDAFDPNQGLRVAEKRCNECLFSKNKIVDDDRKAEVIAECARKGSYFICHKSHAGPPVICRGFFDEVPNRTCHMAKVLRIVQFVDPVTGEAHAKQTSGAEASGGSRRAPARDEER